MQANELIAERYKIIEPLGEGGMANVYRAHDMILDRDVSVKLLRLDLRDDSTIRQRFENEIAASTELVHPNIIQVYDFGETNQLQFLVTEYVKGEDLKRYIAKHHPLTITRTLQIMDDILAGVAMAHSHNIVHRDLKPQNILIDEAGRAKITDFGIALAQSSLGLTKTDVAIGSIHYMSPEQVKGGMATTRSDIYALGIILYEMLVGKVPFDAPEAVSVALMHSTQPMPFVRDIDPRIPQALENVILKATQKIAMDRYNSVDGMREDLSTVMAEDRINEPRLEMAAKNDISNSTATKIIPASVLGAAAAAANKKDDKVDGKTDPTPISRKQKEQEKKPQKKPKKKMSKKRRRMGLLVGLLALILGIFLIVGLVSSDKVTMTDFRGYTEKSAKNSLKEDGLKVGEVYHVSDKQISNGKVIKTDPRRGTQVDKGSSVNLYVSTGAKKVRFGDYTSEKYSKVERQLEAKGFTVKEVQQNSTDVPEGYIIAQDVDAETLVNPGETTVTFTVSKGQQTITVPSFQNMSQNQVQAWADKNGVTVSFNKVSSDTVAADMVISQSVKAGTKVTAATVITVTISSGSDDVTVPDFSGKTLSDVQSWAKKNGINVQPKTDVTSSAEKGKITSQSVSAGDKMQKGNTITVTVSAGTGNSHSSDNNNTDNQS
ncbi:Stk1 family PASTA domain-containing Ser/Thr kinase [Weissella kandleri]|uniref:Stk1 family PASTA domain-containing Ser/Thr kinase n=1 Tax=Weissella kandleri TaxID=1616 RepID=UPI00387E6AAD